MYDFYSIKVESHFSNGPQNGGLVFSKYLRQKVEHRHQITINAYEGNVLRLEKIKIYVSLCLHTNGCYNGGLWPPKRRFGLNRIVQLGVVQR